MRKLSWMLLGLGMLPGLAWAQSKPVVTYPSPATTKGSNVSGTIGSTGVFQQLWPATSVGQPRKGCTIQNNGASGKVMYVTEGLGTAASTTVLAAQVPQGATYYCAPPGGSALQGEIDITGTTGDAFYAAQE